MEPRFLTVAEAARRPPGSTRDPCISSPSEAGFPASRATGKWLFPAYLLDEGSRRARASQGGVDPAEWRPQCRPLGLLLAEATIPG